MRFDPKKTDDETKKKMIEVVEEAWADVQLKRKGQMRGMNHPNSLHWSEL